MLLIFLWFLVLIHAGEYLAIGTFANLSYIFDVFNVQRFVRDKLSFPQVTAWNYSASSVARDVCEPLPDNYDRQYCQRAIGNHVRLHRMNFLDTLMHDSHQNSNIGIKDDPTVTLPQSNSDQYRYRRERDHEMIFVLEHFDSWDLNEDSENDGKTVCFLGESVRVKLLSAFLSLKSVRNILYSKLYDSPSVSSDSVDSISMYLKTPMFKSIMEAFPNKRVTLRSDLNGTPCSVVILPSDEDILQQYSAGSNEWPNSLLDLISSIPKRNQIPFLWVSDIYHESRYESNYQGEAILEIFRPHQTLFRWYLQTSWGINSFLVTTQNDQEGFPTFGQVLNTDDNGSQFLTSSLFIGYLLPMEQNLIVPSKQEIHSIALEEIKKENMVIILTYQVRAYAETAKGLKQQLQQELFYPHVLIIPSLTLEMMDLLNDFLLDLTLNQQEEDNQEKLGNYRKPLHVVQVILTPHVPSSRFVSSLTYPLKRNDIDDKETETTLRRVIFSYVLVQLEQEWLYRRFIGSFVAGVPLIRDARSVWTFSPVQREAVVRTYFWQLEKENQAISVHFDQYSRRMDNGGKKIDFSQKFVHKPHLGLLDSSFVDIVPIFAPCFSQTYMPCSENFHPQDITPIPVERYTLVFFGLCSPSRVLFLQTLFHRLQAAQNELPVNLKQNCMLFDTPQLLVQVLGAFEGGHRDKAMLDRSTIVLNINNYNDSVLEVHRMMYLLSMGKCVLSQRGRDAELVSMLSPIVQGAVYWVDTVEDVLQTVAYLLTPISRDDEGDKNEEENTRTVGRVAWEWIKRAHGPYKRLADCERRSLEAYQLMHHLDRQKINNSEEVYGSSLLEKAMDSLRQRLLIVEKKVE